MFFTLCQPLKAVFVKSELEISGNYSDILLIPREKLDERSSVLLEFKYIKQEDYNKNNNLLKKKQLEAKNQLLKYKDTEEIRLLPNLTCYSVVTIKDKLFIEPI